MYYLNAVKNEWMGLVIFITQIKVILKKKWVYFIKEIVIQCCIENIEDFLLIKPRGVFFKVKKNLSFFLKETLFWGLNWGTD